MQERSIVERITLLERKVEELSSLPARMERVESQIVQLRHDMRSEFLAIRQELDAQGGHLGRLEQLLEVRVGALSAKITEGDEETRRYMRVLYEDLVSRIAAIGEGRPKRR